jgi:Ni/Co efflux regulator RcnB
MKKLIVSGLIAASAIALSAGAASAQPYGDRWGDRGDRGGWTSINARQDQLDRRIDRGVHTGQLNRREARGLRQEFNQIARLESRYRANGLSNWERADLNRRFDILSSKIRFERRDRNYGYGYGYGR